MVEDLAPRRPSGAPWPGDTSGMDGRPTRDLGLTPHPILQHRWRPPEEFLHCRRRTTAPAFWRPPADRGSATHSGVGRPPRSSPPRCRYHTPGQSSQDAMTLPCGIVSGLWVPCSPNASSATNSAIKWSTCSSVWIDDSVTLRRDVPVGTVGGRMAGTHSPCCLL